MRLLAGDNAGGEDPAPADPAVGERLAPGDRPRRTRRPQEKFARLLASSTEIFAEQGYVGTSVQAICRRAGVSVGSFYDHFDDKADLMLHLVEQSTEDLVCVRWQRPRVSSNDTSRR